MYICLNCGKTIKDDLDIGCSYLDKKDYCEECLSFNVSHVNKYDTFSDTIDELIQIADERGKDYTVDEVKILFKFLNNLHKICKNGDTIK